MKGLFDNVLGNGSDDNNKKKSKDREKLTLHKEELDINKSKVPKGEVELSKEIVESQEQTEDENQGMVMSM